MDSTRSRHLFATEQSGIFFYRTYGTQRVPLLHRQPPWNIDDVKRWFLMTRGSDIIRFSPQSSGISTKSRRISNLSSILSAVLVPDTDWQWLISAWTLRSPCRLPSDGILSLENFLDMNRGATGLQRGVFDGPFIQAWIIKGWVVLFVGCRV